jgi:uncharacterized protein
MEELEAKLAALRRELEATGGVMVAFSGGADSAFLLAAATDALGDRAVAATGVSPSLAETELADARALATELGARHLVVPTHEGERPGYLRNGPDRCFFCKDELFDVLGPLAAAEGLALAVGTNTDDLGDHRPGQRAAAGTPARLSRVERAEALLRSFGLAQLRVRDHGDLARVEVPTEALADLVEPGRRARLAAGLHELGFTWVTLDLDGFRSGSMNAALQGTAERP